VRIEPADAQSTRGSPQGGESGYDAGKKVYGQGQRPGHGGAAQALGSGAHSCLEWARSSIDHASRPAQPSLWSLGMAGRSKNGAASVGYL